LPSPSVVGQALPLHDGSRRNVNSEQLADVLQVRVIASMMSDGGEFAPGASHFTLLGYHKAGALSRDIMSLRSLSRLTHIAIGHAIAHEIGHLLLGPNSAE